MKTAGYTTGAFGKWGLGYPASEGSPNNQGFDQFYGYNGQIHAHNYFTSYLRKNDLVELNANIDAPYSAYSADIIKDRALEFVEANKNKPFFLYFCPTLPHNPYHQPDDKTLEYYAKHEGILTATIHHKQSAIVKPDFYYSLTPQDRWIVYPWESKDSQTIQDYATKGE